MRGVCPLGRVLHLFEGSQHVVGVSAQVLVALAALVRLELIRVTVRVEVRVRVRVRVGVIVRVSVRVRVTVRISVIFRVRVWCKCAGACSARSSHRPASNCRHSGTECSASCISFGRLWAHQESSGGGRLNVARAGG